jgi:hypothetical protein
MMSSRDFIHHYTNIRTLALILQHKTIRFNRLDRVDDVSEAQAYGNYDLAKYLFVSCWTDSDSESIPQWHMYTNEMTGVRISLQRNPFNYRPWEPPPQWRMVREGEILSPIPFDRFLTDEYLILPSFLSKTQFERKVQYVDDVQQVHRKAVDVQLQPENRATLKIERVSDLAGFKNKVWEFQQELRFVLVIFPAIPIPEQGPVTEDYTSRFSNHVLNSILNGVGPSIDHFDVDIEQNALDNMVVTLGPLCTEGDRLIVEALLAKYTKNGKLLPSHLTGTIRKPMR